MKTYKNIQEVDKDLSIFKLRADIEEEKLKFHAAQLKEELSARALVVDLIPSFIKRFVFKKIIGRFKKKR